VRRVDDDTGLGRLQMRESSTRGQKRTQQVVVDLRTPVIEGVLDRRLIAAEAACQVHQNVDPAVFAYGAVDQPLDLALIGQRPSHSEHAGACVSQFFGPGFNVAFIARTNRQLSAVFCQRLGDGLADLSVAAHARYYGHLIFEVDLHVAQFGADLL
jgi:hypothetical protein